VINEQESKNGRYFIGVEIKDKRRVATFVTLTLAHNHNLINK
jgi:hypothetical protein